MDRLKRKWMYERCEGRLLKKAFVDGVRGFIEFAKTQQNFQESSRIRCPCRKCENRKYLDIDTVTEHLYKKGFLNDYYEWVCHGEDFACLRQSQDPPNPFADMVIDALGAGGNVIPEEIAGVEEEPKEVVGVEEEPNPKSKNFFEMLSATQEPLFEGSCISFLEMASRITSLKCEYNLPHRCVDEFTSLISEVIPEKNSMSKTYFEKARANRCASQLGNTSFDPGQGSASTRVVAERMAKKNNGVLPTAAQVYELTHSVVVGDNDTQVLGDKARKNLDKYSEKRQEYEDNGVEKAPDDVYLEVVGGPKKGVIYDLLSAAPLFCKKPRSSKSAQPSYNPSMMSQLSSQIEESKRIAEESKRIAEESLKLVQANKDQYEKERAEWKKEEKAFKKQRAEWKKLQEAFEKERAEWKVECNRMQTQFMEITSCIDERSFSKPKSITP